MINRRLLLKSASSAGLLPLLAPFVSACSGGDSAGDLVESPLFAHGVASGDPLSDRVILWTRISDKSGEVSVSWEVARDRKFQDLVVSDSGTTSAARDYTVKVDVTGLDAATVYYYRFIVDGESSTIGRTKTLAQGAVDQVRLAVVSCSNYPAGYFHVYREVAEEELDAVLHLGDYIYEYGPGQYATENAAALDREPQPPHELLSLSDYRARYAQYHGDEDLRYCHATHPFIAVWDDHEVANDAYIAGAENHNDGEGDYAQRRLAAFQAYFEWMPIRPPSAADGADGIIYRAFSFGSLVRLVMLDTRQIGRDQQIALSDYLSDTGLDLPALRAAIDAPDRSLLGDEQRAWLDAELSEKRAPWLVLGQQVLMGRYELPAQLLLALDPSTANPDQNGTELAFQAVAAKKKAPAERSASEQELLDNTVPYNLDAWDGYAKEREALLNQAIANQQALVVLAGDTHNSWASALRTTDGALAGIELGAPSVSSPGLESYLGEGTAKVMQEILGGLVDDLKYSELTQRGFLLVEFTGERVSASFEHISSILSENYERQTSKSFDLDSNLSL